MSTLEDFTIAIPIAPIIEITDSSGESDNECSSNTHPPRAEIDESTNASDTIEPTPRITDGTKKNHNRRKSVHHSVKSTEDLSFESGFVTAHDEEAPTTTSSGAAEPKRKRWNENNINDAIEGNLDDPEMSQMLRKIAYCRVFTNYLLRQYDMLAIDFKLYSNIDLLMLELKKRVDTYTAIRRSRQTLVRNRDERESS